MKEFDKLYFKHMLERKADSSEKANKKEVGKRVEQELMTYIDQRKEDMSDEDYSKAQKMVSDIAGELNPETIFDDLMKVGEIVGLKDSYSRVVGKVVSIVDELEDVESLKADVLGEPEAEEEPEGEMEPEPSPEGEEGTPEGEDDLDLGLDDEEPEAPPAPESEDDLDLGSEEPEERDRDKERELKRREMRRRP